MRDAEWRQQTVLVEGGKQTFLAVQALQMALHPLSPESHLGLSRENERGCVQCLGPARRALTRSPGVVWALGSDVYKDIAAMGRAVTECVVPFLR